jgi:PAS domain S-box-containing protein
MRQKFKVLHLEDIATDAELAARELRKSHINFEQLVIDTEEEYLDALLNFKPDIILCDHSLPAFNSVQALRIKRMQKLHIPFILITATMSDEVALDLVREGADDYILKDSLKRLPHAVQNALEKYGRERERKLLLDHVTEKEAASQEVQKNLTNKLLLANKAASIGVWDYFVQEGRIICDDYLLSLYDKKKDEFDGTFRSWINLIHIDDRKRVKNDVAAAWRTGVDLETEFRVIWPDGSLHYIKSLGITEYNEEGKPTRMVGTNKNITERKMSQQILMESEDRYRAFFENSIDAILLTTPEGQIMAANEAACDIFQKTEAEIIAGGRTGIVDVSDPGLHLLLEQRRRTGKMRGEVKCLRKDGTLFLADVTSSTFKNITGEERTSMIVRDMTEWKAAQDRLLKSEAGLKESQKLAHLGSWSFDAVTGELEWSDEVYRIFGLDRNETLNGFNSFIELIHPEDTEKVKDQIRKSVEDKIDCEYVYRINVDGNIKYLHEKLFNFFDEKGGFIKRSGTVQDVTERIRAQKELEHTSEALETAVYDLNKIMDSSLDVICTIDKEGRFSKVSAASINVWGFSPEELIGRKYMDLVYKEDIEHTNKVAALIMQGIDFTNFENRYVRKDGTIVPLLWSASWDNEGKTMHCIAKDATEKKRFDIAFENERLRFAALFDQAPSSIGIFKGPEHVFEMANPLYLQLTGRQNVVGKPIRAVFPELEGQGAFELLDQVYTLGVPFSGKELPVKIDRERNGKLSKFYTNFVYQPYTNSEGKVEGIFFFMVDVTEQVVTRKKVEENEKNYSLLFHNSPLSQFICDKESQRFIEVNAAALKQYGYTREEFLGLAPTDLHHTDDYLATNNQWREKSQPGVLLNSLLYHQNKKGERLIVEVKTSEITYHGASCILTILSDLTQEIRLQEKIAGLKVNEQKKVTQAHIKGQEKERAYIGRELHDNINQQLTTAKLYLDLAKDREDMRLSLVEKSEGVIQKTINEIRNLSKAFMLPTQEEMNLEEIVRELISTYAQFEDLQFHLQSHESLTRIDGELKLMFYRIIQEQLNNIIKYAECKNVWIEFDIIEEAVYLVIKDDGKGFDVVAKRKGIGLSNIKGRLELHNGELDIISSSGEGCAVHILVPWSELKDPDVNKILES